jgi:uncharacterized protein
MALLKSSRATAGCTIATIVIERSTGVQITSFLVKIASRCNLACDYCYMYQHADQEWRKQPVIMAHATRQRLAQRIGEYVQSNGITEICVVFHGGEPLLAGPEIIAETADWLRAALPAGTRSSFSLQTNGVLLDEAAVQIFLAANIAVSLSLDGDNAANDLHRLDHLGRSTYEATRQALDLLESNPNIFSGVISVVDPKVKPEDLFGFFAARRPPRWDFLLPDAHHDRLPPGRAGDPTLYERWLIEAFDVWFERYPDLPVRTFEALIGSCLGLPSQTDAFGFGDPSLLTIETDGSYHDLDVLKITRAGFTALGSDLAGSTIEAASRSGGLARHASLLRLEGLAKQCQRCPESQVCGGGAVPHRFAEQNELDNPTVYCGEMLALIGHIRRRLGEAIQGNSIPKTVCAASQVLPVLPAGLAAWENAETSEESVTLLLSDLANELLPQWEEVVSDIRSKPVPEGVFADQLLGLDSEHKRALVVEPGVRLWTRVQLAKLAGKVVRSTSGSELSVSNDDLRRQWLFASIPTEAARPRIHAEDSRLRDPFEGDVLFETGDVARQGVALTYAALELIDEFNTKLLAEISKLSPDIQFVFDPKAGPDSVVSFSDDSVPGCLYVSVRTHNQMLDAPLLADSIIHEHRHQKLYLLQRKFMLFHRDDVLIESPWRSDPRPPSGLLHALFVFVPLHKFWHHVGNTRPDLVSAERAKRDRDVIASKLQRGFQVIRTTPLTGAGEELVSLLEKSFLGDVS